MKNSINSIFYWFVKIDSYDKEQPLYRSLVFWSNQKKGSCLFYLQHTVQIVITVLKTKNVLK